MRYCTSTSTLGVRRSYNKSESRAHIILCFVFYIVLGGGTWPSGSPPSRIPRITDIYNTAARVYTMRCGLTATSFVPRWLESERYASAVMTSISLCTLAHWVGMRSQLSYLCLVPILKDWLFGFGGDPEIGLPMLWWMIIHLVFTICTLLQGDVCETRTFPRCLHSAHSNNLIVLTKAQLASYVFLGIVVFELPSSVARVQLSVQGKIPFSQKSQLLGISGRRRMFYAKWRHKTPNF